MPTVQSEDPNERVNNPRWYNSHPSGIACIELIEHLPCNLANATKYLWRCGLKSSETPLRDLQSARWYLKREEDRIELYELDDEPKRKTEVVWRALARRVIEKDDDSTLGDYLRALLSYDFDEMIYIIDGAIQKLEEPQDGGEGAARENIGCHCEGVGCLACEGPP
jgi:hypothetical protein